MRISIRILLASTFYVLCSGCSSGRVDAGFRDDPAVVLDRWEYRFGDAPEDPEVRLSWFGDDRAWQKIRLPGYAPGNRGQQWMWMRARVPAGSWTEPALRIDPVLTGFEVYVDGELMSSPSRMGLSTYSLGGFALSITPLPIDCAGKWVYLRIHSCYNLIGVQGRVSLGSRASHLKEIVQRDLAEIILGVLLLLLGIVAVGIAIFSEDTRLILYWAWWALSTGLYAIFYTNIRDLITSFGPNIWLVVWSVALSGLMAGFGGFWLEFRRPNIRPWMVYLLRFELGVAMVFVFLSVQLSMGAHAGPTILPQVLLLQVVRGLCVVNLVLAGVQIFRQFAAGSTDARILFVGFAAVFLAAFNDIAIAWGMLAERDTIAPWGLAVFTIALGVNVYRRHLRRRNMYVKKIETNAVERAMMTRDLHDGLGGITTSIIMLSKLSLKNKSVPDRIRSNLDTILELSVEGLGEIRGFMSSLDSDTEDWQNIASEIRVQGKRATAACGKHFTVETNVNDHAPSPNTLLQYNVLKIFREALTNAIKHGEGDSIEVQFDVGPDAAILVVENQLSGVRAGSKDGVNMSRGLNNMRKRAEDSGAQLKIDIPSVEKAGETDPSEDQKARLMLEIPLLKNNSDSKFD